MALLHDELHCAESEERGVCHALRREGISHAIFTRPSIKKVVVQIGSIELACCDRYDLTLPSI